MMPCEAEHASTVSHPQGDPPGAGNRASRLAYRALRQHAEVFESSGMRNLRESEDSVLLEGDGLSLVLEHRLQRRPLSRIYNLRVSTEVRLPVPCSDSSYRLTLKTGGFVNAVYGLSAAGPKACAGQRVARRVTESGLLDEVAKKVDLEDLSISWTPEECAWRVALDPYPGSHIQMLLPPVRYTVGLKEPEAVAIRDFLGELSDVLVR